MDKIDCTTCKYGYEEERLGIPMCHHPKRFLEDCVNFNMHEEKHIDGNPDKSLEEAAEKYTQKMLESWKFDSTGCRPLRESFIAGAEWQKEQDQPITGNSLEQEWLRYVDRKKKECRGELPSLGEYGWLQIARHFAEWQKSQMLKEAVEGQIYGSDGDHWIESEIYENLKGKEGDKIRIVVLKDEEYG